MKDVAGFEMIIRRDEGEFRHLTFSKDLSIVNHFHIITWPWCLCITGDMGTYVFSRVRDMFTFFRLEHIAGKEGLFINLDYWSEKLLAVDKVCPVEQFSYELFKQIVQERIDAAETTKAQRDAVESMVANLDGEPMEIVYERVCDFQEFEFADLYQYDLTEYCYHFIWCCYAIAWGIQQYDAVKAKL